MTDQTNEPVPNPYNAKKHDENVARGFVSADDSLYSPPQETVADEEVEQKEEATAVEDEVIKEEPAEKYSTVDYKKRYDDLKRHYDRKVTEFKSEKQRLIAEAQEARPKFTPPKTPEELATFREEYSDIYGVIETVAHMQADERIKELEEVVSTLQEKERSAVYKAAKAELLGIHPDFETIAASDDFQSWASKQPVEIQKWVFENATNASLAARAMDLYKKDRGLDSKKETSTPKKKERQPSAADVVSVSRKAEPVTGEKRVWKTSEIDRLSVADYEKYSSEIDAAFKEGRIVKG